MTTSSSTNNINNDDMNSTMKKTKRVAFAMDEPNSNTGGVGTDNIASS